LHKDPKQRPTAQILTMIKFFQDPFVHALQFLDVSKMKDVHQKEHFYTTTLRELLPYMPKVRANVMTLYIQDDLRVLEEKLKILKYLNVNL